VEIYPVTLRQLHHRLPFLRRDGEHKRKCGGHKCESGRSYPGTTDYGEIVVGDKDITIKMNRKRTLPLLKESIPEPNGAYQWLCGKKLIFTANTHT
jgi:hypothetical protein